MLLFISHTSDARFARLFSCFSRLVIGEFDDFSVQMSREGAQINRAERHLVLSGRRGGRPNV